MYRVYYKKIFEKLEFCIIKFYLIRYSFVIRLIELKIDVKMVCLILGYFNIVIVLNLYVYLNDE